MQPVRKSCGRTFRPNENLREQAKTLAAFGIPAETICRMIFNPKTNRPISLKTLRRHFRKELDAGAAAATTQVVDTLFRQAVGAPADYDEDGNCLRAEVPPNLQALMFWLKTQAKAEEIARAQRAQDQSQNQSKGVATLPGDALDRNV